MLSPSVCLSSVTLVHTDRKTDRQTDRHTSDTTTAHTALAWRRAVIKWRVICAVSGVPVIQLSIKIRGESVGSRDSSTCAFSLAVWRVGMLTSTCVLPSTPSGLWIGQFVHVDPPAVRRAVCNAVVSCAIIACNALQFLHAIIAGFQKC